jgi:hypothetical protein
MLAAEIDVLNQLVKTHRQVHRRADYFQRIDSVRRAVRTAFDALQERRQPGMVKRHVFGGLLTVPGESLALAAVDRALDRIPPAWRLLHHLLAQSYFMPYALVHLAVLARLSTLLTQERTCLAQSGARTAGDPPLLCALAGEAAAPDAPGGQVKTARAVAGCEWSTSAVALSSAAVNASTLNAPAAAAAGIESDEDLGEAVVDERSREQLQDLAGNVGGLFAGGPASGCQVPASVVAAALLTTDDAVAAAGDHKAVVEQTEESAPIGWVLDTVATTTQVAALQSAAQLDGDRKRPTGELPPAQGESQNVAMLGAVQPPAPTASSLPAQASLSREAEQAVPPAGGAGMVKSSRTRATQQQAGKRRREEGGAVETSDGSTPHAPRNTAEAVLEAVAVPEGLVGEPNQEGEPSAAPRRGSKRARQAVQQSSADRPRPQPISERPARSNSGLEGQAGRGYDALLALTSLVRRHWSPRRPAHSAWRAGRPAEEL